jgi:hypothetical protein
MPPDAGQRFEREMACTEAEWLRWLAPAIGQYSWQQQPGRASVTIGSGTLELQWRVLEPRPVALLRLPRLLVSFQFSDVRASERQAFMNRFDLYMQRGGG